MLRPRLRAPNGCVGALNQMVGNISTNVYPKRNLLAGCIASQKNESTYFLVDYKSKIESPDTYLSPAGFGILRNTRKGNFIARKSLETGSGSHKLLPRSGAGGNYSLMLSHTWKK